MSRRSHSMPRGVCEFCGEVVTEAQKAAWRVRGWEVERNQGGANTILGRERQPNRIVHARCAQYEVDHGRQEAMNL